MQPLKRQFPSSFYCPLLGEALKVGLRACWQGSLLTEEFVHDGYLCIPLLHLVYRGPGHVVLKLVRRDELVRTAWAPFLHKGRKGEVKRALKY